MKVSISSKLASVLVLLSEQNGKSVDEMASVLLSEAVRQSLAGNVAFPSFNLERLFEEEIPTQPSNPPPAPPAEPSKENDPKENWKGRSVWCHDCTRRLSGYRCGICEQTEKRPTEFQPAFGR